MIGGSMKYRPLVVLGLSLILSVGLAPAPVGATSCTRVSGGSQTGNWVQHGGFDSLIVNDEWERQTRGGQSIDRWELGGSGWSTRPASVCSPTTQPGRLVLQVLPGREKNSVEAISDDLAAALEAVAVMLPSVTRITLIPPVAGPECTARLSRIQPLALDAIYQHLGPAVDLGPIVILPTCAMFADPGGHLTAEGSAYAAQEYATGL